MCGCWIRNGQNADATKLALRTCGRGLGEEREHMDVQEINGVKHVLRSSVFLVPIGHLAHGHLNPKRGKIILRRQYLLSEFLMRQHRIEERF